MKKKHNNFFSYGDLNFISIFYTLQKQFKLANVERTYFHLLINTSHTLMMENEQLGVRSLSYIKDLFA